MESDIKLEGDFAVVEGSALMSRTWDIMLDAPDRRVNLDGYRRALVHASNDGLIINFEGDYPGGVTIAGKTQLETISAASTLEVNPPKPQPSQPPSDYQVIEPVEDPLGGLLDSAVENLSKFTNVFAQIEKSREEPTANLAAEIRRLRDAVLELNERVKRLENP